MKFKVLKIEISEVETMSNDEGRYDYSMGWIELEIDNEKKNLCVEMVHYKSGKIDLEFGFSDEWFIKSHHIKEWVETESELYKNILKFLESWEEKFMVEYWDVYEWDYVTIGYECEI